MVHSSDEALDELDRDVASAAEIPLTSSKKKRRLNNSASDPEDETESDYSFLSDNSERDPTRKKSRDGVNVDGNGEREKLKSKYKIHIPKNSDLPRDAFFTQPPQRSSSPYRIDEFHWRKPGISPTAQPTSYTPAQPQNPHVNSTLIPLQPTDNNAVSRGKPPRANSPSEHDSTYGDDHLFDDVLETMDGDPLTVHNGLDPAEPIFIHAQVDDFGRPGQRQSLRAPLANLKQTTLFGTQAQETSNEGQSGRRHNWPLVNREEAPTHHELSLGALETWVYPTNLGNIRDYQYSIAAKGLYHNVLVALPTGLGKTFIAATIMLNWFRWTLNAHIVFVAPTKPLVSQQVKACFEIAGIPRSATSMLTGSTPPGLRAEEWNSKRVFFMTPQTLINDLKTGICDPKRLVLLVVDEAHRATGNYAYVEVVKFVRRFNSSFRVLALTATPGSSIETVQEVIDGLGISRVEIRTEESIDIRQYVHPRKIETVLFDNSEEMVMVMDLFSKALQPVVNLLNGNNAYWSKDPMSLTPFGCNQARQRWMLDVGKSASWAEKGLVQSLFSLLASLSHGSDLLKFHGIGPFYHKVLGWRNEIGANGKKGGKYARQISESEPFRTMMSRVQIWINNSEFIGHPKLEYLQSVVMNHFLDAGEGRGAADPSSTRIMVFAHYRDSAEEIARVLKRNEPMVRPHVFVGQATSKASEGMDQKKQLDIIQKFKNGVYNTLVATSIGEEGLDIGEVDLIVCYDASASPIRMLQRMGRTGRKRAGNIVVTLMKGKEENNFSKAKDNYEKMQTEIASGVRFNFRDEESRRIVPIGMQPIVDKKMIDIPVENTQAGLPEPTKIRRAPKRPPKKFHMPDGVRKGFVNASRLDNDDESDEEAARPAKKMVTALERIPIDDAVTLPPPSEVFLTPQEQRTFESKYLNVGNEEPHIVEIPRVDAFPELQGTERPWRHISHGRVTQNTVKMLKAFREMGQDSSQRFERHLQLEDRDIGALQAEKRVRYLRAGCGALLSSSITSPHTSPVPNMSVMTGNSFRMRSESTARDIAALSPDIADADRIIDKIIGGTTDKPSISSILLPGAENEEHVIMTADSDDELPDFSILVRKQDPEKSTHGRRRPKRKTILDESDDE